MPHTLSHEEVENIISLVKKGLTFMEIHKKTGYAYNTIVKYVPEELRIRERSKRCYPSKVIRLKNICYAIVDRFVQKYCCKCYCNKNMDYIKELFEKYLKRITSYSIDIDLGYYLNKYESDLCLNKKGKIELGLIPKIKIRNLKRDRIKVCRKMSCSPTRNKFKQLYNKLNSTYRSNIDYEKVDTMIVKIEKVMYAFNIYRRKSIKIIVALYIATHFTLSECSSIVAKITKKYLKNNQRTQTVSASTGSAKTLCNDIAKVNSSFKMLLKKRKKENFLRGREKVKKMRIGKNKLEKINLL